MEWATKALISTYVPLAVCVMILFLEHYLTIILIGKRIWHGHPALLNAMPIRAIFSTDPSLDQVALHEVRMRDDGPGASLRFELSSFPSDPPPKWIAAQYNRAQLTLRLLGVIEWQLTGWNVDNVGKLALSKEETGVFLQFDSSSCTLRCHAQFATVETLSGHRVSDNAVG